VFDLVEVIEYLFLNIALIERKEIKTADTCQLWNKAIKEELVI